VDLGTVWSMRVLGAEVSLEGAVLGTTECPQKEEQSREQLSVSGRRSGLGKVLGLSRLREDAWTFFLGLQWACRYVEFVAYSGCS